MINRIKNLIREMRFVYGVKKPVQKKVVVKGWNTLSAKEINRLAKERQLSR